MVKKRIFSIILLVICLLAFTGCGGNSNTLKTKKGDKLKITKSETSQI